MPVLLWADFDATSVRVAAKRSKDDPQARRLSWVNVRGRRGSCYSRLSHGIEARWAAESVCAKGFICTARTRS